MKTRRHRFTLIELLIAVAIIGILVALLFPVLGQAKRRALEVTCLSNVRQLGMGLLGYADDNSSWYPYRPVTSIGPWDWSRPGVFDRHEEIEAYVPPGEIYHCPFYPISLEDIWPRSDNNRYSWYSYAVYAGFRPNWVQSYYQPDGTAVAPSNWNEVVPRRTGEFLERPIMGDHTSYNSGAPGGTCFHNSRDMFAGGQIEDFSANYFYGDGSASLQRTGFSSWLWAIGASGRFDYQWVGQ